VRDIAASSTEASIAERDTQPKHLGPRVTSL
jgi:hypothetical protein